MLSNSLVETPEAQSSLKANDGTGAARATRGKWFAAIAFLAVLLSSLANCALAHLLDLTKGLPQLHGNGVYRRVGPQSGPQVFCAGSSILVSGLNWPEVSSALGMGIEDWTVAGSSPEVWEGFQKQRRFSNLTIVGVSIYDLNEMRLAPERASYVPFTTTVADLWASGASPDLKRRILAQYGLKYLRILYPLAGQSDKVFVGLRSKAADLLGERASLQQHEGVVVEKSGVLEVIDADTNVSQWSSGRLLRRLDDLQEEDHGAQNFSNGPKSRALRRLLLRAQQQGRVIVVVLPVPQYYADAFLDKATIAAFEKALRDDMAVAPQATLVRLDQIPGISDNANFFDLVHMNSSGRELATPIFLKNLSEETSGAVQPTTATQVDATKQ